jgi:hypothetical protein
LPASASSAAQAGKPAGLFVDALTAALKFGQGPADSGRAEFPSRSRPAHWEAFRASCRRPLSAASGDVLRLRRRASAACRRGTALARRGPAALDGV